MTLRNIFINYRRDDSRADAGRLFDRLNARYPGRVFRDVGSLEPGVDWQEAIEKVLGSTDACIVVIGPRWVTAPDANGNRRIDNPRDTVRKEVSVALKSSMRVFPILVGGAKMPSETELPEELQPLLRRNALELSEQDFDEGVNKLVKAIERTPGWAPARARRLPSAPVLIAILVIAAIIVGAGYLFTRTQPRTSETTSTESTAIPSSESSSTARPPVSTSSRPLDAGAPGAGPRPTEGSGAVPAGVGQVTFNWNGARGVSWQVLDESKRTTLRTRSVDAGQSDSLDIGPGNYFVVMSGAPEIQPMPIKVVAGQATAVAPAVGQMTLTWRGAKGAVWQVLDESKRTTLRTRSVDAGQVTRSTSGQEITSS